MVKRYNMTTSCRSQVFEEEASYGDWVPYSDYEKLEQRVQDLEGDLGLANGALEMVRESLVSHGVDMEACPPMMYPEAIRNAIVKVVETDRERWIGENRPPVPGEPIYLKTTFEVR